MHNPELYASFSTNTARVNNYLLEKYLSNMQFKKEPGSIFEVGCGDANTTVNYLLPKIPKGRKDLVGIDVSEEMIAYAKKQWDRSEVKFMQMDITDKNTIPREFHNKFNHGFSFYTLHWITNKRAAYQNMFNLLSPKGDLLEAHIIQSPLFETYVNLAEYPRWRNLIPKDIVSSFENLSNEFDETKNMLKKIGFSKYFCKLDDISTSWSNPDTLREFVTSIDPIISELSEQEKEDYMDAYMEQIKELEGIRFSPKHGPVYMDYQMIVVYASKG